MRAAGAPFGGSSTMRYKRNFVPCTAMAPSWDRSETANSSGMLPVSRGGDVCRRTAWLRWFKLGFKIKAECGFEGSFGRISKPLSGAGRWRLTLLTPLDAASPSPSRLRHATACAPCPMRHVSPSYRL